MVLSLAPLRPDEMAATGKLLVRKHLLLDFIQAVGLTHSKLGFAVMVLSFLSIKLFLFLITSIPPGTLADNLPDGWVIISLSNIESEDLS